MCAITKANAQYDVHFAQYWNMLNFYNPAGAGATGMLWGYAAYSNQLSGFENNPKSMLINVDAPIPFVRGDHNLGLGALNDDIGLFTNQHIYINYAYGFKLFGGRLAEYKYYDMDQVVASALNLTRGRFFCQVS